MTPGIFIVDDQDHKKIQDQIANFSLATGIESRIFSFPWDLAKTVGENVDRAKDVFLQELNNIHLVVLDYYFEEPIGGMQKTSIDLGLLDYFKGHKRPVAVLTAARDRSVYSQLAKQGADYITHKKTVHKLSADDLNAIFKFFA